MTATLLTDKQLLSLYHNDRLDKAIREAVQAEMIRRQLTIEKTTPSKARLPLLYKIGLLLLPMFFPCYLAVCGIKECGDDALKRRLLLFFFLPGGILSNYKVTLYLVQGERRRWRAYWNWLALGWLLWTGLLILSAMYYFFKTRYSI